MAVRTKKFKSHLPQIAKNSSPNLT